MQKWTTFFALSDATTIKHFKRINPDLEYIIQELGKNKFPRIKALAHDCIPISILNIKTKDYPDQLNDFKKTRLIRLLEHFTT